METRVHRSIIFCTPREVKRLTLNQKLWRILAPLWFGVGVLVVASAWMVGADMLERRRSMLSQQMGTTSGLIPYSQKMAAFPT